MKTDDLIHTLVQDLATPAVEPGAMLRRTLPVAFGATAFGWLALAGVRADLLSEGLQSAILKVALGVCLASVGLGAAVKLTRPEQAAVGWWRPFLVVGALALLAVIVELVGGGSTSWSERLIGHSIPVCLLVIPALAMLPLACTLLALRRGATAYPTTVGALAGIASAGLAIVAYGLFCDEDSALFIATWYIIASGIAGLIGAAAGKSLLRW